MHKAKIILVLLLLILPFVVFAQEYDDDEPEYETDWDDFDMDLYSRGDQVFVISVGTVFPTVFKYNNPNYTDLKHNFSPPVGGTGTLCYSYFLNSHFFVGGEFGGLFINTIGGNTMFIIPLGVKGGYQFVFRRFEFPLAATIGMNWCRLLNTGYYGFFAKAGAGAYFRATPSWSFGLQVNWAWYPQWMKEDKTTTAHGNFIDTIISARYHF